MSQSTAQSAIDLRGRPAVVDGPETTAEREQPRTSKPIPCHLNVFFDPTSNTAFFKLRLSIDPLGNSFVFLFIEPEQVTSIAREENEREDQEIARLCESPTRGNICLRLTLSRPGTVIAPLTWPPPTHRLDDQASIHLLFLASQTILVIHVGRHELSTTQLSGLCSAASTPGLLTSHPDQASYFRVFGGHAGKAIQDVSAAFENRDAAPGLPSYDEVAGSSRSAPEPGRGEPASSKKRRRGSPAPDAEVGAEMEAHADAVTAMAAMRDQMRDFIQSICDESEVRRHAELQDMVAELRAEVFAELGKMEARINESLYERIEEVKYEVKEQIEESLTEAVNRGDLEDVVDDCVQGFKIEMEEFVKDELRGVEDTMLDHFENGTWSGTFQRPEGT